jgi:hypothetical protein
MTYLAEHALPIWIFGVVLVFLAWVTYLNLRTTRSLLLIPGAVALVAALLLAEWLIETPREAVQRRLYEMADVIEADDLPGTLTYISGSSGEVRAEAETLMPQVEVETANVIEVPTIEVNMTAIPPRATLLVHAFVNVTERRNGMKEGVMDWLRVTFVLEDGQWVVQDYEPRNEQIQRERDRLRSHDRAPTLP